MTGIATNQAQLVQLAVRGRISHPGQSGSYTVDQDDRPTMLPGMSGVSVNLRVGDGAFDFACDHGEAGVSAEGLDPSEHLALQVLACLGNRVTVLSGEARGAIGTVAGKHAFVLIDFPATDLGRMVPGDQLLVRAWGQGLAISACPQVATRNCGPELLERLPMEVLPSGALSVDVVGTLPPEVMGAGLGMSSEWANCDVMLQSPATTRRLGLESLRIGDLVAMDAQDHRFGRAYDPGWTSIGVIVHALSPTPGHGVGVVTVLTGPRACFEIRQVSRCNLRELLDLPQ
ncbi:MAG: DUF4438 domain-containing protein [Acidimicrobiales bacterium]